MLKLRESAVSSPSRVSPPRQRDVMERVLAGHPSKNISADLGISQRTVESHSGLDHEENRVEVAARPCWLALLASGGEDEPSMAPLRGRGLTPSPGENMGCEPRAAERDHYTILVVARIG